MGDDLSGATEAEEHPDTGHALSPDQPRENPLDRRDYDVAHYLQVLLASYVGRLRKAFTPEDFDQLFRPDAQLGLFDRPIDTIQLLWIRCQESEL